MIFYTVTILKDSLGADTNEYAATLVIDVVRMMAAMFACFVVKTVKRRTLTILSGGSTAIFLFALSFYLNLSIDNSLKAHVSIPLGLFVAYTLVISIGLMPLPWCLTGEVCITFFILNFNFKFFFVLSTIFERKKITFKLNNLFHFIDYFFHLQLFPLRFRAIGSALVTFFNFLCFFTIVKASPIYFNIYGASKMFLIYGMFTSIGTAFLVALLPETKNKTLQEIEHNYTSKRKHKINRNKIQP